jgi:ubiquinone/menaquinone biosynthesis C-methylase UbiE
MEKSRQLPKKIKGLPPHSKLVEWDRQKISRYWDVFGNITPTAPWFSEKAAGWLVKNIKNHKMKRGGLSDNLDVIDLGAGSGKFLQSLQTNLGANVTGLDISPERIANALQKNKGISYLQGTMDAVPAPDNSFDIVVSTQTVEHLLDQDLDKAFSEMARILKPKGLLFITTRFNEDLTNGWKVCPNCHCVFQHSQHMQSFTIDRIEGLCTKAGLQNHLGYRSRCRDHFHDFIPRRWRLLERTLYFLFSSYLDRHIGKYLVSVSEKQTSP